MTDNSASSGSVPGNALGDGAGRGGAAGIFRAVLDTPIRTEEPERVDPPTGRTRRQRSVLYLGAFIAVGLVLAAGLAYYAWRTFGGFERVSLDLAAASDQEPKNYLVVGSDSREVIEANSPDADAFLGDGTGGQRADSIFIVRAYPEGDRLDILAFPRDLWVDEPPTESQPGGTEGRINGTYNEGPQHIVDTIVANFGIEINHYVEIDFAGFVSLVDVVGGVPMYFENAVRDTNSGLFVDTPGCVTLDGQMAIAYARSRHLRVAGNEGWVDDPTGDLGRITRQQEFLRAAMARFLELNLSDVFTVKELVEAGVDHVRLDPGLGIGELVSLGERIGTFEDHAITTYQLPTEAFQTSGGAAVLGVVDAEAAPIISLFSGEVDRLGSTTTSTPAAAIAPAEIGVDVLNGSGIDGQAGSAGEELARAGFEVGRIGDAEPVVATQVWHGPDGLAAARVLAGQLTGAADLVLTDDLAANELVVITGPDFGSVRVAGGPVTAPAEGQSLAVGGTAPVDPESIEAPGLSPASAPDGVECG